NSGPTIIPGPTSLQSQSISVNPLTGKSSDALIPTAVSIQHSNNALGQVSVITTTAGTGPILAQTCGSGPISVGPNPIPIGPVTVTSRRANNTSVTMINSSNTNNSNSNHRISVFEPYPMRDTVQHFCEKHLDKIKAYMDNVSLRIPPPAKCTIEERRSKKQARLSFACGRRGPHCLYARAAFSMRTRAPRVWIHLMFLALQARHAAALSSRDPTVASLKHCWDILKCENKTFLTLVTGAFPGLKEQEMLLNELRAAGFFDVFEVNSTRTDGGSVPPTQATWGCFLCNHPERAVGFLAADGQPVIEGQLKEKKGRWRLFRRWRTRYFTLSGAHLSCKGSSGGESIDINQIRSVKVSRGARNIPKAFEIFTGDQTLILKPKDGKNAEEWAQCLSIAVAHSQARDAPAKANSLPARGLTLKSF
ncbi:jg26688, partial [Pararge aegeria aegeria]